jgi:hypothetical protein
MNAFTWRSFQEELEKISAKTDKMLKLHQFLMPATVSSIVGAGSAGILLPRKGSKKSKRKQLVRNAVAGGGVGLVRAPAWKALSKGYAKAVKRPLIDLLQ